MVEFGNLAGTRDAEWIGRPPHEELQLKVRPLLPSDDPFYQPPPGFQHAEPGTVLRSRDVELAFLGLIPQPARAVQLLYRTMDMNGEPEATVTTVIVPAELAPGQSCPLLSYQCAIDAMTSRCFPSYALRRRAKALGSLSQFEFLLINACVAEGWAVSVPDHEGIRGSWGAPYEPGYRVLDGIRAALSSERMCLAITDSRVVWARMQRNSGRRPSARSVRMLKVSSMRSTSNGDGLTGTSKKSAVARQSSVVLERKPGVSMMTKPPPAASRRAAFEASSLASSTTATPPSARSRATSRVIERCGSASISVGRRPRKCQCAARQLASVLLPLPPFMVATVMIMCRTPRSCDKTEPSESARGTVSDSPQTAYCRQIDLQPIAHGL